ncbi:peptide ABC transporter substrate-binding protein [Spirochaetota bacterium]
MINKTCITTLLIIFNLAFFSCGSKKISGDKVILNVHNGDEIRHLDPQLATGIGSAHITINLFAGLFEYHHKTARPVKHLVSSYYKMKNSTQWVFKLRKDIYWVKNKNNKITKIRPVNAQDVVFSYRRILSPKLASEYAYMLYILKNAEKFNKGKIRDPRKIGVKAMGKWKLKLTLEGPAPSFISYLPHHSFKVVPREPIEKHGEKWIIKNNIWTSSAFAFKEWKLKDRITLTKNPHYPEADKTQVDEINFIFIGVYSPDAVRVFRAGRTDIDLMAPPTSEIPSLKEDGTLKITKQLGTYFVRVNLTRKILRDIRIRKALALTIPRKDIVDYIAKSGQVPAYSFVPDSFSSYNPVSFTGEKSRAKRVARAKKLMKEAGFPNGKGFPEIFYFYNTAETHQKIAVVMAKAWKADLGITVKPFNQEWKVFLNTSKSLDYDLARSGWVADMEDPINFLEMFISGGGNNQTGFSSKKYDRLIKLARIENNLKERASILRKAEAILMKEIPIIPVFNYTSISLTQKYISNFHATKLDQHPMRFVKIDLDMRKKLFSDYYE